MYCASTRWRDWYSYRSTVTNGLGAWQNLCYEILPWPREPRCETMSDEDIEELVAERADATSEQAETEVESD